MNKKIIYYGEKIIRVFKLSFPKSDMKMRNYEIQF